MTKTINTEETTTSVSISCELKYGKATSESVQANINTLTDSIDVRSVPTSRTSGEIKMRIASREIPKLIISSSTK